MPERAPTIGTVFVGLGATVMLHGLASLAVVAAGTIWSRDGGLIVFLFWIFLGVAQWVYLLPAVLVARAMGWRGVAKGLWIGGALGVLLTVAILGMNALGPLKERMTGDSAPNSVYSGEDTVVVEADAAHVTVRFPSGRIASYAFTPETVLDYPGATTQQQRTPAGLRLLVPGLRVNVTWVVRGGIKRAVHVSMYVEAPE